MRNFYSTGINKEQIKYLNIMKEMLVRCFIDPRTNQPIDPRKRCLFMNWCTFNL